MSLIRTLFARRSERQRDLLPMDMFDHERTAREAKAARLLERLYHRGQARAWDGKELLQQLLEKHGGIDIPPARRKALRRIFTIILWGELAAWKVAAELAHRLEPLEARMAATSQAHDEARHFYVMHDYLSLLGEVPRELGFAERHALLEVIAAETLPQKLIGMHLMVEPVALTLFQCIRESRPDPVLADLLYYYERDEARHVALGVQYLPELLSGMGPAEAARLYAWQIKLVGFQMMGLSDLRESFEELGLDPRRVLELGKAKQLLAADLLAKEMGWPLPMYRFVDRALAVQAELAFPQAGMADGRAARWMRAAWVALHGADAMETRLEPERQQAA